MENFKFFWFDILILRHNLQLQTQFSQRPNGQNAKFQCLSGVEFLEFSKNGLTFYHSPFLLGGIVKKQWAHFFGETL